jgi:hypothetical protein
LKLSVEAAKSKEKEGREEGESKRTGKTVGDQKSFTEKKHHTTWNSLSLAIHGTNKLT